MMEEPRTIGILRFLADHLQPYPIDPAEHLADEEQNWQTWLQGAGTLTIPAHTKRTAIIDLENYYCVYPSLTLSGGKGANIRLYWAESLYCDAGAAQKGNRDEVNGKYFIGGGEEFLPDGGMQRRFTTLWWEAGRYLELSITTADEPITFDALVLAETRYLHELCCSFTSDDKRLEQVIPTAIRTLEMCTHENYMDCPYYEQ
jgi:hypothetical protein